MASDTSPSMQVTPRAPRRTSSLLLSNQKPRNADPAADMEPQRESIWVGVRMRPLNDSEKLRKEHIAWEASDDRTLRFTEYSPLQEHRSHSHLPMGVFCYDKVFPPSTGTQEVYEAAARDRVLSAMQGLNATIFVYGQTGSGKTHNMRGIVQRASADVFQAIRETPEREYLLRLSAIEIYNEEVRDMLVEVSSDLQLLEDVERGGTVAKGLTEVGVRSAQHLSQLLKAVESRRQVRETTLNIESSRSHLIIRFYVESRPTVNEEGATSRKMSAPEVEGREARSEGGESEDLRPVKVSNINFVDLAGSERSSLAAKEDGLEKLRQKEGSAINKSLLTLGKVIRALGEGQGRAHVPFRESKLTRILQPSLGGNSRTAIVVTISPSGGQAENTRAALHFATAAKRVTMLPTVNEVVNEKALLRKLQREIGFLRQQLATKDFAAEAAELSAALKEKEEEVRSQEAQRTEMERRLRDLERLVLHAETNSPKEAHASGLPGTLAMDLASSRQGFGSTIRQSQRPGSRNALNAAEQQPTSHTRLTLFQKSTSDRMLLDCFLTTSMRDRFCSAGGAEPDSGDAHAAAARDASTSAHAGPLSVNLSKLEELQGPQGEEAEAAVAALQAEVRLLKHTASSRGSGDYDPSATIARLQTELARMEEELVIGNFLDAAKEETIRALRTELARLKERQSTQEAANMALASLQNRIDSLQIASRDGSLQASLASVADEESPRPSPRIAHHPGSVQRYNLISHQSNISTTSLGRAGSDDDEDDVVVTLSSPSSPVHVSITSPLGSPRARAQHGSAAGNSVSMSIRTSPASKARLMSNQQSRALSAAAAAERLHAGGKAAQSGAGGHRAQPPHDADARQWYRAEMKRMQSAFQEAAARDMASLRAAMESDREAVARLDCQKQVLVAHVLRLEMRLDQSVAAHDELTAQLEQCRKDLTQARAAATAAVAGQAGGAMAGPPLPQAGTPIGVPLLQIPLHMLDNDDTWAATPSAETLLPKIVELWSELAVPLVHRSRFYLAFRGRETFYYEAEHRRLQHLRDQLGLSSDGSPEAKDARRRLDKARRRLDWERRWLAQQLKWDFAAEEREELFLQWNVHRDSKERKLQLVKQLWSANVLKEGEAGMHRSAELVLRLHGTDATDGMFDLVFGKQEGEGWVRSMLTTSGKVVAPLLQRTASKLRASPSRLSRDSTSAAGLVQRRPSFWGSIAQGLTPRRPSNLSGTSPWQAGSPATPHSDG